MPAAAGEQLLRSSAGTKRFEVSSDSLNSNKSIRNSLIACTKIKNLISQSCLKGACKIAVPSALLAVALKLLDNYFEHDFLSEKMPDKIVYSSFSGITGMLIVFRTVQALAQYREGASLIYKMNGCWCDAASSLLTFTRNSQADKALVDNFRHTVIRLFSLLNMLCLAELENCSHLASKQAVSFEVIDTDSLDLETLRCIKNSDNKVEATSELIQCIIVDGQKQGLLDVPPPLLTRAFSDVSIGMMNFYSACNVAHVGIPLPYVTVTEGLLMVHAIFTPMAMCTFNQGPVEAFIFTFLTVLLPWSLNFLASELGNPFGADENDLPVGEGQYDLNQRLHSFLRIADQPTPSTNLNAVKAGGVAMIKATTTIHQSSEIKYTLSDFFTRIIAQAEKNATMNAEHAKMDAQLRRGDSTLSAIIAAVAPDMDDDKVLSDVDITTGSATQQVAFDVVDHEGELSNPAANTAGSCNEKVNRIDGPRVLEQVLEQDEGLGHESALPPHKNSEMHPPAALADLPLEKEFITNVDDCADAGFLEFITPASTPRPSQEHPDPTPLR